MVIKTFYFTNTTLVCTNMISGHFRKVKDAWDNKKDMLLKSGAFAVEQLSQTLSASASSNKLPDNLPETALYLCAEQV